MPKKRPQDNMFYEAMPGVQLDHRQYFPPQDQEADWEGDESRHTEHTDAGEQAVRQRMIRQGLILLALLVFQVILFVVLIRSTVNLG